MLLLQCKKIKLLNESNFICVWGHLQRCKKSRLFSNLSSREFNLRNVGGTRYQQNLTRVGNVRCLGWVLSWDFTTLVAPRPGWSNAKTTILVGLQSILHVYSQLIFFTYIYLSEARTLAKYCNNPGELLKNTKMTFYFKQRTTHGARIKARVHSLKSWYFLISITTSLVQNTATAPNFWGTMYIQD